MYSYYQLQQSVIMEENKDFSDHVEDILEYLTEDLVPTVFEILKKATPVLVGIAIGAWASSEK